MSSMIGPKPARVWLGVAVGVVAVAAFAWIVARPPTERRVERQLVGGNVSAVEIADWGALRPADALTIRAEDARELYGSMKLAADVDNRGVLDEADAQADVRFVWVEDKVCAEGEDPAVHRAVLQVTVEEAGTYYPWARVWWTDSCGNSIVVTVQHSDDEEATRWEVTDGTHQWWHWLRLAGLRGVDLKSGSYTVIVENREDGARLSRILFSRGDYESYMPSTPEG